MTLKVTCETCSGTFDEDKVEIDNISSDKLGRDVVYFICPNCKQLTSSFRFEG